MKLKAPFPAFGGKSTVAHLVWPRLSDPTAPARNYVEPFCFSAAMLLRRADEPQIETVNDLNSYVANFWRAVKHDPEAVAEHADWPVVEDDLHARHRWLVRSDQAKAKLKRVREDPDFYDARIAGWWCWGACCWIGSGWCEQGRDSDQWDQMPKVADAGHGIHGKVDGEKRPALSCGNTTAGPGVLAHANLHEKRPRVPSDPSGYMPGVINGSPNARQPALGQFGWGINANRDCFKRPCLTREWSRGTGVHANDSLTACETRRLWLIDWMVRLSDRLCPVRVCCGHWARVCDSDSTLTRLGTTAVFLDPPYRKTLACGKENRASHIYANDKTQDVNGLVDEVQDWCLKWGGDRNIRIAVCGLEGEYPKLDEVGWEKDAWKSRGGYGNRSDKGKENRERERIWFSPHCLSLTPVQNTLFTEEVA